jgi:hypothetical protein
MDRYDPVVKVVHDDIKIAKEGDSNTITEVSKTLNSVGSDEIFDYLITQADLLNASDIHIENQRTHMRIRMRIDGVLHPVADLENDRYRVILSTLASRAEYFDSLNRSSIRAYAKRTCQRRCYTSVEYSRRNRTRLYMAKTLCFVCLILTNQC